MRIVYKKLRNRLLHLEVSLTPFWCLSVPYNILTKEPTSLLLNTSSNRELTTPNDNLHFLKNCFLIFEWNSCIPVISAHLMPFKRDRRFSYTRQANGVCTEVMSSTKIISTALNLDLTYTHFRKLRGCILIANTGGGRDMSCVYMLRNQSLIKESLE